MKEKVLEDKMLELAKVVKVFNEEKAHLQELRGKRSQSFKELDGIYDKPELLDVAEIQVYKDYIERVTSEIRKKIATLKNIEKVMKAKQDEVNQALKEKKIFEKLKENEEKKFFKEFEKKERAEIDDIAVSRYTRK